MTTNENHHASALLDRLQLAIERKLDDMLGDFQADLALLEEQLDVLAETVRGVAKDLAKKSKSAK